MKTFEAINTRITAIENAREELHLKIAEVCEGLGDLREELIDACDHPEDSVFNVRDFWEFYNATAPWIVCIKCGLAEQGWGSGHDVFYKHDHSDLPSATRKFVEKYVKVKRDQDEQFCRRRPDMHYQTDLEGNPLHPKNWIRIPEPHHDNWEDRKHLKR